MNPSLIPLLLNTIGAVPPPPKTPGIDPVVTLVALFTGLTIIIVVLIIYFKDKEIGWGGLILLLIGFLLMTGSIYKTVQISIKNKELNIKLEQLFKATEELRHDFYDLQKQVEREKEVQPDHLERY